MLDFLFAKSSPAHPEVLDSLGYYSLLGYPDYRPLEVEGYFFPYLKGRTTAP